MYVGNMYQDIPLEKGRISLVEQTQLGTTEVKSVKSVKSVKYFVND